MSALLFLMKFTLSASRAVMGLVRLHGCDQLIAFARSRCTLGSHQYRIQVLKLLTKTDEQAMKIDEFIDHALIMDRSSPPT